MIFKYNFLFFIGMKKKYLYILLKLKPICITIYTSLLFMTVNNEVNYSVLLYTFEISQTFRKYLHVKKLSILKCSFQLKDKIR